MISKKAGRLWSEKYLRLGGLFLLALLLAPILASAMEAKPNIVLILADDLGIGDTGSYGGERCLINTPNIDALAEQGLRFTDAHSSASVCGPTRLALMTGRYPWRFGATVNSGPWGICRSPTKFGEFDARQAAEAIRLSYGLCGQMASWHNHDHLGRQYAGFDQR
jgi:hypothetical protein